MRNFPTLRLLAIGLLFSLPACTKTGPAGATGPAGPAGLNGNANVISVTFTNITVPLNNTYTFQIPQITQAIVDSGAINVYYKGAQSQDTWYPLPQYYFNNGTLVWLILSDFQVGNATLSDYGITASAITYRFDIIAAH